MFGVFWECRRGTRTSIIGTGTAFGAQKEFLDLLGKPIFSPVDILGSIARYQNVLQYAHSKVDCVYGYDLTMSPSVMALQILLDRRL